MSQASPPRWAESLLRGLLPARDEDTITGDMLEEYREVALPSRGKLRASAWYLRQTLTFATLQGLRQLVTKLARGAGAPLLASSLGALLLGTLTVPLLHNPGAHGKAPVIISASAGAAVAVRGKITMLKYRGARGTTFTVVRPSPERPEAYTFAAGPGGLDRSTFQVGEEIVVNGTGQDDGKFRATTILRSDGREVLDRTEKPRAAPE